MSAITTALIAAAVTLALGLVLPVVVRPMLTKYGVVDVPNERSSHEKPVLRGFGLAVLIAMTVGAAVGIIMFAAGQQLMLRWDILLLVTIGSIAAALLGLAEDFRGVSVRRRSIALLLIACITPLLIVTVTHNPLTPGDYGFVAGQSVMLATPLPLWIGLVLVPYAVLFISSYINVANFMDGLNGISGFHGVIAGLTFAAAGFFAAVPWLLVAGLVLAAGFAAFLPWNLAGPGAFLGDVGSYLLGGAVAITSFAALISGVPVLATIGPMIIYFGDVGVTLVKRVRAGKKWDEPHKEHVYQRLQQLGLSHVAASGINAGFTLVASVLGLISIWVGPLVWVWLTLAGIAVLVVYLLTPRLVAKMR